MTTITSHSTAGAIAGVRRIETNNQSDRRAILEAEAEWRAERRAYEQGPKQEIARLEAERTKLTTDDGQAEQLAALAALDQLTIPHGYRRQRDAAITDGAAFLQTKVSAAKEACGAARRKLAEVADTSGIGRAELPEAKALASDLREQAEVLLLKARWVEAMIAPTDVASEEVGACESEHATLSASLEAVNARLAGAEDEAERRADQKAKRLEAIAARLDELAQARVPMDAAWQKVRALKEKPSTVGN